MKCSLLGLSAFLVGTSHAEVLMASTSSGEHLALHGIARPFHHVHKFKTGSNSVTWAIDNVRKQCSSDVQRLCSYDGSSSMPSVVEDPLLSHLMYNAAKGDEFPLMRLAFPQLEPKKSSLQLLDELIAPPPKVGIVRVHLHSPNKEEKEEKRDNFLDNFFEEMLQDTIKFSKNAKVVPEPDKTKEEKEQDDGVKEAIAEETLGVLVNSLLDHASSASASADSESKEKEDKEEEESAASRYDPIFVSKQISQYGQKIVDKAEDEKEQDHELRQRLARRLTEVTPFHGMPPCKKRAFLLSHPPPMIRNQPFSNHPHIYPLAVEKCMWNAHEKNNLSGTCMLAWDKLVIAKANYAKEVSQRHQSGAHERMMLWHQTNPHVPHRPCAKKRRFGSFLHFLSKFIFAFSMFYLVYIGHKMTIKRRKKRFQKIKKIMYAIHNDPELKTAVEHSLGESIQHDSEQDTSSCLMFFDALFDMLPILGLVLLLMHVAAYSPNFVIMIGAPILGLTTCYSFLRQTCNNSTDEQSADGYVPLIEQETPPKIAKTHVYEGVPVQVV